MTYLIDGYAAARRDGNKRAKSLGVALINWILYARGF